MSTTRKWPRALPARKLSDVEIKAIVRHRDGYRCQQCGMSAREHVQKYRKNLDVHRVVPGSPYTVKGCVTLCRACHGPQPKSPKRSRHPVTISFRMPPGVRDAVVGLAERECRSIPQTILYLLGKALEARGLCPPPSPSHPGE